MYKQHSKPAPGATANEKQASATKTSTKSPVQLPPATKKPLALSQPSSATKFPADAPIKSKPSPPTSRAPLTASSPNLKASKHTPIIVDTVIDKKGKTLPKSAEHNVSTEKPPKDHKKDTSTGKPSPGSPQSAKPIASNPKPATSPYAKPQSLPLRNPQSAKPQVPSNPTQAASPYAKSQPPSRSDTTIREQYPTLHDYVKKPQHVQKKLYKKSGAAGSSNSWGHSWLQQQKVTSVAKPNSAKGPQKGYVYRFVCLIMRVSE